MDFENIESRLENWSRVVRSPRFQSGECAAWAKWYVALRDAERMRDVPLMTKDERDGWLVEKAWSDMPNHVAKWVIKYSYVWRMSDEQIQIRMRKSHNVVLRGRKFELVMAEARTSVRQSIAKLTAKEFLENVSIISCKPETADV